MGFIRERIKRKNTINAIDSFVVTISNLAKQT